MVFRTHYQNQYRFQAAICDFTVVAALLIRRWSVNLSSACLVSVALLASCIVYDSDFPRP